MSLIIIWYFCYKSSLMLNFIKKCTWSVRQLLVSTEAFFIFPRLYNSFFFTWTIENISTYWSIPHLIETFYCPFAVHPSITLSIILFFTAFKLICHFLMHSICIRIWNYIKTFLSDQRSDWRGRVHI